MTRALRVSTCGRPHAFWIVCAGMSSDQTLLSMAAFETFQCFLCDETACVLVWFGFDDFFFIFYSILSP
jgi:hypothetical protein